MTWDRPLRRSPASSRSRQDVVTQRGNMGKDPAPGGHTRRADVAATRKMWSHLSFCSIHEPSAGPGPGTALVSCREERKGTQLGNRNYVPGTREPFDKA